MNINNKSVARNKEAVIHFISIERPDSLDDYCVSNALTLFRGTHILMRNNF